jgi:predicted HicB family RNase H-like nuclease
MFQEAGLGSTHKVPLQVGITKELHAKLKRFARTSGGSMAQAVRFILSDALGEEGEASFMTVRLSRQEHDCVLELAEDEGISAASWGRRAIKQAVLNSRA